MFYDERINQESGKIFRNAVIIFTFVFFILIILRSLYLNEIGAWEFVKILPEILIIATGSILVSVGELRMVKKEKDEMYFLLKYDFYRKYSIIFLIVCILGFGIGLPFSKKSFNDVTFTFLFENLASFACVYFVYTFKKSNIYFNYAFLDTSKKQYYQKIGIKIAKLFLIFLIVCGISLLMTYLLKMDNYLYFLFYLGIFFLVISVVYFVVSIIEKVSYDAKEGQDHSSLIIGGITLILFFGHGIINLYAQLLNYLNSTQESVNQYKLCLTISSFLHLFYVPALIWLLSYVFLHVRNKRLAKIGLSIYSITTLISIIENVCFSLTFSIAMEHFSTINPSLIYNIFRIGDQTISYIYWSLEAVGVLLLAYQLMIEKKKYGIFLGITILYLVGDILVLLNSIPLNQIIFSSVRLVLSVVYISFLIIIVYRYTNLKENCMDNRV